MTSQRTDPSYGIPAPITKLTVEQDLKLRMIEDSLNERYHDYKEEVMTYLMSLQHQNFVLSNSLTNLVKKWPTNPALAQVTINGEPPQSGTLYVIKG